VDKTILQLMDEFYYYKVGRKAKHRSAKNYIRYLKQFFVHIEKLPAEITLEDIEKYIVYLKVDIKNAINTQKLKQTAIRLFYDWYSTRYRKENPTESLSAIQEEIKIPVMPTPDELTRMVVACDKETPQGRRDGAIICLAADTGLRRSEISALNLGNIQMHEKSYVLIAPKIKNRRERIIPFGKLTDRALIGERFSAYYLDLIYIKKWKYDQPLFIQQGIMHKGGRLGPRGVNNIIKKYAKKAGINRQITSHSLRHFFGTYSIKNEMDIRILRDMMGHAWAETTERYVHIAAQIDSKTIDQRGTTNLEDTEPNSGFNKIAREIQRNIHNHGTKR